MNILSVDGGASRTRGALFTETGLIMAHLETEATSLNRPDADSPKILGRFIQDVAEQAELALQDVGMISVGVAGVSNLDARELLFKELDRLGLAARAIVTSDVEAAYEAVWGDSPGALVCVGTGAIGWARNEEGSTFRASGQGPQMGGDPGSGFWMGKTALVHLIMDEQAEDEDIESLRQRVLEAYKADSVEEAARMAGESGDMVSQTALLGQIVCELADKRNDVALAIVQEGTQSLAEDLVKMLDEAGLRQAKMTIGMNGGIITKNPIFREMLADALHYDVPDITWRAPEIDPVFGAGLIAARLNRIEVRLDILKKSWREYHLRTQG